MYFKHLRTTPFEPTFEWVDTVGECADRINRSHEDYPKYVVATERALSDTVIGGNNITNRLILAVHSYIFRDKPFAGLFRRLDVRVGWHHPPHFTEIRAMMGKLEYHYGNIADIKDLIDWYTDFEAIHPFQDGNGRVGGVIVAAYSHKLHPEKGWLAPNQ